MHYNPDSGAWVVKKRYYDDGRTLYWGDDISSVAMKGLKDGEMFTLLNADGTPHSIVMMDSFNEIREKKL